LFSNAAVARFINANFEPVWESVRPVPIVRIDFGDGNVITRTLHGNIASYVCFADGQLVDVLPGIYNAAGYQAALTRIRNVHQNLSEASVADRTQVLGEYHQGVADNLKKGQETVHLLETMLRLEAITKRKVERPLESVVAAKRVGEALSAAQANPVAAEDVASWQALEEDTRVNEKARRQVIHEKLAEAGAVQPAAISKWLYKEVLHADLDDPYLGLGPALFASYPFGKEDRK
jgi:hypothetical protein